MSMKRVDLLYQLERISREWFGNKQAFDDIESLCAHRKPTPDDHEEFAEFMASELEHRGIIEIEG